MNRNSPFLPGEIKHEVRYFNRELYNCLPEAIFSLKIVVNNKQIQMEGSPKIPSDKSHLFEKTGRENPDFFPLNFLAHMKVS